MTNRRSLQTNMQRISRAQQFVPGHVGGRVASAQPVRERNKVGAVAAAPIAPPSGAVVLGGFGLFQDSFTLSAAPAGSNTASILIGAFSSIWSVPGGAAAMDNLVVPDGWSVLDTGTWNVEVTWWLLTTDSPETAGLNFTWSDDGGSQVQVAWAATYLSGTAGVGTWGVTLGTANYGSPSSTPTQPPEGAVVWQQMGLISSVWVGADGKTLDVIPGSGSGQYITLYSYPGFGTYGTTAFQDEWINGAPTSDQLTWSSLGVFGQPGSQPMCVTFG